MQPHQQLEHAIAAWMDHPPENVVACSSGTSALHLALVSIGLLRGDRVVMSDYNMVACPRAATLAGLTPVLVDCGDDLNIDPALVEEAASPGRGTVRRPVLSAILATHVYGRRCDMDALHATAARHHLDIIEDLAEAHGVRPHPGTAAACWSFQRTKHVHGEEGGAVAFRHLHSAVRARCLRNMGFVCANPVDSTYHDYTHVPGGHNYRLADLLATPILDSLARFDEDMGWRRRLEGFYDAFLPGSWWQPPREAPWVHDVRIPGLTHTRQDAVVAALRRAGFHARHGFKAVSSQEEYARCRRYVPSAGGKAGAASREVVCLPLQRHLVESDCLRAVGVVLSALKAHQ